MPVSLGKGGNVSLSKEGPGDNRTGEVYRHGGEWKFRAVGQGYPGGVGPLASNYGVAVG